MKRYLSLNRLIRAAALWLAGPFLVWFLCGSVLFAAQDSPKASGETVHYDSGGFTIDAFVAKPPGGGKHPAVIVIHDNEGLNGAIQEITR